MDPGRTVAGPWKLAGIPVLLAPRGYCVCGQRRLCARQSNMSAQNAWIRFNPNDPARWGVRRTVASTGVGWVEADFVGGGALEPIRRDPCWRGPWERRLAAHPPTGCIRATSRRRHFEAIKYGTGVPVSARWLRGHLFPVWKSESNAPFRACLSAPGYRGR